MFGSRRTKIGMLATVSSAVLLAGFSARAQTPDAPTATADEAVGEIVVTASRVAREGFSAPTPTTVIGVAQIEARGVTNITDIINETPAFRPTQTPAAAARGGATSGGSFLDLRGLNTIGGNATSSGTSTARTLVLVDGRRHVPADPWGRVDVNMIPAALVERTEVVTGGASAAWGSDAVAGVVNIILKDRLQGIEASTSYGVSSRNDYKEYSANFAGGASFSGGRGHIIAGIDYVDNRGVPDAYLSRDWGRLAYGAVSLTAARPAGVPARIIVPDVRMSDRLAPGGIIVGGPLDNTEFTGGQGTRVFTPGSLVGGNLMVGGGTANSNDGVYLVGSSNLVNPIRRYTALARARYDFTSNITGMLEYSHAESVFRGFGSNRRDDQSLLIRQDNAFLPESVRTQMVARNLSTITVGRFAMDTGYGPYSNRTDQNTDRVVIAFNGSVSNTWKWDAYYQYGENHFVQRNESSLNSNYLAAIDAVRDSSGQIVCRSLTTTAGTADGGCVPFNIFGVNSPSQQAIAYVRGVGMNDVTVRQQVAAINFNGDLLTLPAGPVSVAVGAEYRKEQSFSSVDNNSRLRRFDNNNFQPLNGEYDTKEIYGETVVPLMRNVPGAESLELNGAVRHTDYSTSGAVNTWKLGATYEPFSGLRFRSTVSRDIRAPNIAELFTTGTQARVTLFTKAGNTLVDVITSGNANLDPEKAKTFTAGVVYQPKWLPGFRASVDMFDININDVITSFSAQQVYDRCNAGLTAFCSSITSTGGLVTQITNRQLNFASLKTSGVDIEMAYSLRRDLLMPGQWQFRLLGNHVAHLTAVDPAATSVDRAGMTVPKWSWNLQATYNYKRFTGNLQIRDIGKTYYDVELVGPDSPGYDPAAANSINKNVRAAVAYVNFSAQYDLIDKGNRQLQLFGVVNNVFDRDPPAYAGLNVNFASLYDIIGRTYRLGLRLKY